MDINGGPVPVDLSKLSEKDKWDFIQKKLLEEHQGHESMHSMIIFILLASLICFQIVLIKWKKLHYQSYMQVSLFAMWITPMVISISKSYRLFCLSWTVFTIITAFVMYKAIQKPISKFVPRLVYKWFLVTYMFSYVISIVGSVLISLSLIISSISPEKMGLIIFDIGLITLFYGVYFGVLCRDLADLITERMAISLGYYTESGIPLRNLEMDTCAICCFKINKSDTSLEKVFILNCKHAFHEFCIRGWCIVGKKQTCPYCREKVELQKIFCNPWEKPHLVYSGLLDIVRYVIAWQPIIITIVQIISRFLKLK